MLAADRPAVVTMAPISAKRTSDDLLLRIEGVSKTFPGLRALDDVSLSVHSGEIVAVVGHNGSGKSTLVKLLAGVQTPDAGGDLGVSHHAGRTRATSGHRAELHFIHQDLGLVDSLSAVDNLNLTRPYERRGLLPLRRRREMAQARALVSRFGAEFDVREPVRLRSAPERSVIAIARALSEWSDDRNVLLLDEPTEALHVSEVDQLFRALHAVADRGGGVIFISHRLDEVFALADRIVVLRDGRVVADTPSSAMDRERLADLITARQIGKPAIPGSRAPRPQGRTGGSATHLIVRGLCGGPVRGIDLDVRAGEIVGLSGVLGSGRERVNSMLFGAVPANAAVISVGGRRLERLTPSKAIRAGIGYVPGNRVRQGAVMTLTLRENVTLPRMSPFIAALGRLDSGAERREVGRLVEEFDVRPPRMDQTFNLFSGGNQQKAIFAKWLRNKPSLLLLDEPTQGVDIGAKSAIYAAIRVAAESGAAVIVASADTKELAEICDRVLVIEDGTVTSELRGSDLTEARLVNAIL
jgi:ABC-type sugar transport system ATPase subunit